MIQDLQQMNDQHQWFGSDYNEEQTSAVMDEVQNQVLSAVEKAVMEQNRARGTVPAAYQAMIDRLYRKPKIPWWKVLRHLVHGSFINQRESCYFRPVKSRIYLDAEGEEVSLYPSSKKLPGYTVLMAIDTSGSMSDTDLVQAANELLSLAEQYEGSKIYCIQCDAAIEKEFELESADQSTEREEVVYDIGGRGGTDFNPPFARFMEGEMVQPKWYANTTIFENRVLDLPSKVDAFVYFTDGYAPAPERFLDPQVPVFWVITPHGNTNWIEGSFGSFIKIEQYDEDDILL
jgi:predicted metal-dependent peptidase